MLTRDDFTARSTAKSLTNLADQVHRHLLVFHIKELWLTLYPIHTESKFDEVGYFLSLIFKLAIIFGN